MLSKEFFRFALAGAAGFIVDAGVLHLSQPALGYYGGRALSFACAVFTTWLINRSLTFRDKHSGLSLLQEFLRYVSLMLAGGAVNYGCYVVLTLVSATVREYPVLGVAAGSIAGMLGNYLSVKFLLFRHRE